MGVKPIILSSILFIFGGFYHMAGIYVLRLSQKKIIRFFFITSVIVWMWSLSVSFAIVAKSASASSFWFRWATVLWGFFTSFLFHFSYVLAKPEKKNGIMFYLFVYTPALFIAAFFLLLKQVSVYSITVFPTEWGWTFIVPISFILVYYSVFTFVFNLWSYFELARWYKGDEIIHQMDIDNHLKKVAVIFIVVAIALAIVSNIFNFSFIHASSLVLAIPILLFVFIVLKYRFLDSEKSILPNQFDDSYSFAKVFDLVGYSYILLTHFIFGIHFLSDDFMFGHIALHCGIIYAVGISHFFVTRIFKRPKHQYYFVALAASFMILSDLFFHSDNLGTTVWTMYFFAAMITTVFDRLLYSRIVISTMMISQLIYYIFNYNKSFFDLHHFFIRLLVIFLTGLAVQLINKLYYSKRYESKYQFDVQETLAELSQNFVNINSLNKDEKIQTVLVKCNQNFDSQRAYILKFNEQKDEARILYFQRGNKIQSDRDKESVIGTLYKFGNDHWGVKEILSRIPVLVNDIERLPKSAIALKLNFRERKTKGFHAFPITIDEDVKGMLFFEFDKVKSDDLDHQYKQVIANLIGDAIKKVSYEERLFRSAHIDLVTGLYNRVYFSKQFGQIIADSNQASQHAVLFIDIDNFKNINDAFGHSIGDEILRRVAEIIKSFSNQCHILSRFGGDEFVVAYTNIKDRTEVTTFIDQILSMINSPIKISRYEFRLSISIGLAFYPEDGVDIQTLIKNADLAMYASKSLGKNRYYFCNDYVKNQTAENINYTNKLINALSKGEMKQVYQPQMDIATGHLTGIEVLLRWHSPEFGDVPPAKFIPLLEHMGLIGDVGEWVIENAIAQHFALIERGLPKIKMSVNLSGVQLQNALFIDKLSNIIKKKAVEPKFLELEILEKLIIDQSDFVINNFEKLREIGCLIAVDDFGVEFSSLNRLQELPIDRLKIDQHFIEGIGVDQKKESVITIIIELAEALGFTSIAEGVETAEQFEFLRACGCQEIQGFYYSKPLLSDELEQFLIEKVSEHL